MVTTAERYALDISLRVADMVVAEPMLLNRNQSQDFKSESSSLRSRDLKYLN